MPQPSTLSRIDGAVWVQPGPCMYPFRLIATPSTSPETRSPCTATLDSDGTPRLRSLAALGQQREQAHARRPIPDPTPSSSGPAPASSSSARRSAVAAVLLAKPVHRHGIAVHGEL